MKQHCKQQGLKPALTSIVDNAAPSSSMYNQEEGRMAMHTFAPFTLCSQETFC